MRFPFVPRKLADLLHVYQSGDGPVQATGGSSFGFGGQWERKNDDGEIARRVMSLLGDKRMLCKDFSLEIEEHCPSSADHARKELGKHLDNPEVGVDMARRLRLLRRLFRDFMDEVGPGGGECYRHYHPMGTDPLSMSFGRLRGLIGVQIGELAAEFDLDVSEELAAIVPDQTGWFFERFEG